MACDRAQVEKELKQAFDLVDKDKSGFIDTGEVEQMLNQYLKGKGKPVDPAKIKSEVAAFIKDLDSNQDNKVSLKEFTDFVMQAFCS
jgi:Ca2+-binding EF-hand superfamily protein